MGTAPISDVMSYFPSNMGVDAAGKAQQTGEIFAKAMSDAAAVIERINERPMTSTAGKPTFFAAS